MRITPAPQSRPARLILTRYRDAAIRAVAYFFLAAGLVLGLSAMLIPGYAGDLTGIVISVGLAALQAVVGIFCWYRPDRISDTFLVYAPFASITMIAVLNILTQDASAAAQFYFAWPVLYAATYLHRRAVVSVLIVVTAAQATVVLSLMPPVNAISDIVGLVTGLAMISVLIVKLRERVDDLVTVLENQALADPLTGLANRRAFARDIEQAVARARRSGAPLALMTIDVDGFKQINDARGHAAGDVALQRVATALRTVVRASDMVARLGGDEFAVLLETDQQGATRVAQTVRATVANFLDLPGGPPTLSIGLASMPADADSVETLIAASDAALYQAKTAGRDRIAGVPKPTGTTTTTP